MMQNDQELLKELGADTLPEATQQQVLERFYAVLNERVGIELGQAMSEEQLDTFDKVREAQGEDAAFEWLAQNVPVYFDIFKKESQELKQEIKQVVADLGGK